MWAGFVFCCNCLVGQFVLKLEISDLVAEGDKFLVFWVEGNGVDNVAGAFYLLS